MGRNLKPRQLGQECGPPDTVVCPLEIEQREHGPPRLGLFERVEYALGDASNLVSGGVAPPEARLVRGEQALRLQPVAEASLDEPFQQFAGAAEERDWSVGLWDVGWLAFLGDRHDLGLSPHCRHDAGLPALVEEQEEGLLGWLGEVEQEFVGDPVDASGLAGAEAGEGGSELFLCEGATHVTSGAFAGAVLYRGSRLLYDWPVALLFLL